MTRDKGKIGVLCENYDEMTEEGKNELVLIGEHYLNEFIAFGDEKYAGKNNESQLNGERLV